MGSVPLRDASGQLARRRSSEPQPALQPGPERDFGAPWAVLISTLCRPLFLRGHTAASTPSTHLGSLPCQEQRAGIRQSTHIYCVLPVPLKLCYVLWDKEEERVSPGHQAFVVF